eukprot:scaffold3749_cov98-Skeletonema_marinoi.AAC.4
MFDQHLDNKRRWCGRLVRSGIEGGIDYKDHSLGRLEASDARYSELSSIIDLHASTCAVIDAVAVRADFMPS